MSGVAPYSDDLGGIVAAASRSERYVGVVIARAERVGAPRVCVPALRVWGLGSDIWSLTNKPYGHILMDL